MSTPTQTARRPYSLPYRPVRNARPKIATIMSSPSQKVADHDRKIMIGAIW